MPRIRNLMDVDIESTSLEQVLDGAPAVWADLMVCGYQVTGPDLLGRSGGEGVSWFLEVGPKSTLAWIWSQTDETYLGSKFLVEGPPTLAVPMARKLVEELAQEEGLSGVQERSTQPPVVRLCAA